MVSRPFLTLSRKLMCYAELRKNMTSDLIVHVVGAKADLANTDRAIPIEYARKAIRNWVSLSPGEDPPLHSPPLAENSALSASEAQLRAKFAAGRTKSAYSSRGIGFGNLALGGRSTPRLSNEDARRSASDLLTAESQAAWCDVDVTEVSAKDDYGEACTV